MVRVKRPEAQADAGPGLGTQLRARNGFATNSPQSLASIRSSSACATMTRSDQTGGPAWSSNGLRECYRVAARRLRLGGSGARLGNPMHERPSSHRPGAWPLSFRSSAWPRRQPSPSTATRASRARRRRISARQINCAAQLAARDAGRPVAQVAVELADTMLRRTLFRRPPRDRELPPDVEEARAPLRRRLGSAPPPIRYAASSARGRPVTMRTGLSAAKQAIARRSRDCSRARTTGSRDRRTHSPNGQGDPQRQRLRARCSPRSAVATRAEARRA